MRARTVVNSSKFMLAVPVIRLRWYLAEHTPASQSPPKCGALGGIMRQSIEVLVQKFSSLPLSCWDRNSSYRSLILFLLPTKLRPLSEKSLTGLPLLETKRCRAAMNASAVRSPTSSRCIARVAKQRKTATYALYVTVERLLCWRMYIGPAKSTPALRNGHTPSRRAFGRSPIICCIATGFALKQVTHLRMILRTVLRPCCTQNRRRNALSSSCCGACRNSSW
uniref:(northern house mosquito) hypothetical protein n=1 Tax=Culex pipiens TaxID=7175 RepID=A0A8D8DP65_CULPI